MKILKVNNAEENLFNDENANSERAAKLLQKKDFNFVAIEKKRGAGNKTLKSKPYITISPSKRPDGQCGLRIGVSHFLAVRSNIKPGDFVIISIDKLNLAMRIEKTNDHTRGRKTTATSKNTSSWSVKINPYKGIPVPKKPTEVAYEIKNNGINFLLPMEIDFVI